MKPLHVQPGISWRACAALALAWCVPGVALAQSAFGSSAPPGNSQFSQFMGSQPLFPGSQQAPGGAGQTLYGSPRFGGSTTGTGMPGLTNWSAARPSGMPGAMNGGLPGSSPYATPPAGSTGNMNGMGNGMGNANSTSKAAALKFKNALKKASAAPSSLGPDKYHYDYGAQQTGTDANTLYRSPWDSPDNNYQWGAAPAQ